MRDGGAEAGQQEQTRGEAGTLAQLLTAMQCNAGARAVGYQFTFQTLQATSQDGLSLEFVAGTAGRE